MDINEETLPSQSGNSGKYLTTDGSTASWDTITAPTPAAVSDAANTSTGYFALPSGTTAQRPGSAAEGYTRYNTTTGSIEFYDGTNWIATNLIPSINSVTGTIYAGVSSTLTLSLANSTDTIDVKYYEGGTLLATDSGVTVTSGSATSTVPSAVYGQTAGDTISIQVFNQDGTPSSNSISKTVAGLPTGGTITTSGSYRIHTFTSSSSFVVPSGMTLSNVEYLVVAGGGGGAAACGANTCGGGGGGAGGMLTGTFGSMAAGSYSAQIGAGGIGTSSNGGNSSINSVTSIGGGSGGGTSSSGSGSAGSNGGSGGGGGSGGTGPGAGGSGTSGQGTAGANATGTAAPGGGGGGKGSAGSGQSGGSGQANNITGSYVTYAAGGNGGGSSGGATGASGAANTGNGGVGGSAVGGVQSNGGSGIVIVRYQI
jgi:hypothetical protein